MFCLANIHGYFSHIYILFIIIESLVALEANDRSRVVAIVTTYFDLEGDITDATMLRLAELLLMEDTETALSELEELSKGSDISPRTRMFLAHVASELGGAELAFESFQESGINDILTGVWHPMHRAILQLPAFKTCVRDSGLYDYWRESGNWADLCRPVGDDDFVCD